MARLGRSRPIQALTLRRAATAPPAQGVTAGSIASAEAVGSPTLAAVGNPGEVVFEGAGALGENTVADNQLLIPYPAGIQAGDLLVVLVGVAVNTVPGVTAGWTDIVSSNSGGSSPTSRIQYKIATGSETGNLTFATANSLSHGIMLRYSGVDSLNPVDTTVSTAASSTAVTSFDVPGITTTKAKTALLIHAINNSQVTNWSTPNSPAAFTELADSSALPSMSVHNLIWTGSGATGDITVTAGGSFRGHVHLVALRPQSVGPVDVNVIAGGLTSGEAFGDASAGVTTSVTSTAIVTDEAFANPVLSGSVSLAPTAVATAQAFGSPTVSSITSLAATAIATGQAFGSPTLSMSIALAPTAIASGQAFGTSTLSPRIALATTAIPTGEAFGSLTRTSVITSSPAGLADGSAYGSPSLSGTTTLSPVFITSYNKTIIENWDGGTYLIAPDAEFVVSPSSARTGTNGLQHTTVVHHPNISDESYDRAGVVTIKSWVRFDGTTGPRLAGVVFGDSILGRYTFLVDSRNSTGSSSGMQIRKNDASSTASVVATAAQLIPQNVWHLIEVTLDSTDIAFRVFNEDGTLVNAIFYSDSDVQTGRVGIHSYSTVSHDDFEVTSGFGSSTLTPVVTLSPTAITTGLAFGTTVQTSLITSTATAIVSAEAHGSPVLSVGLTSTPTAIGSAQAFGAPALTTVVTATATAIATGLIFGSTTLLPNTPVSLTGISTSEAFGSPTIAVTTPSTTLAPSGIATPEVFGSPTVIVIPTLTPTAITSLLAFGSPTRTGVSTSSPSGFSDGSAQGSPTLGMSIALLATAIASGQAFGSPVTSIVILTVTPNGIASAQVLGTPTSTSTTAVIAIGVGTSAAFGIVLINGLADFVGWGIPIGVNYVVNRSTFPSGIASAIRFGLPEIDSTISVASSGIATEEAFGVTAIGQAQPSFAGLPVNLPFNLGSAAFGVTAGSIATGAAVGSPTLSYIEEPTNEGNSNLPLSLPFNLNPAAATSTVVPTGITTRLGFGTSTITRIDPPTGETSLQRWGMSATPETWSAKLNMVGTAGITVRRWFGDLTSSGNSKQADMQRSIDDGYLVVISDKVPSFTSAATGAYDSWAQARANVLQSFGVEIYYSIWHEPYDNMTAAEFTAMHRRLMPFFASKSNIRCGPILHGWLLDNASLRQSRFTSYIDTTLLNNGTYDYIGIDTYQTGTDANPGPIWPMHRIPNLKNVVSGLGKPNIPLIIGEWNCWRSDAFRASGFAIGDEPQIKVACLWNNTGGVGKELAATGDPRLQDFKDTKARPSKIVQARVIP